MIELIFYFYSNYVLGKSYKLFVFSPKKLLESPIMLNLLYSKCFMKCIPVSVFEVNVYAIFLRLFGYFICKLYYQRKLFFIAKFSIDR